MKKMRLPLHLLAAMALAGGAQAVPAMASNARTAEAKSIQQVDKVDQQRKHMAQSRAIQMNGLGGIDYNPFASGLKPKEYGEYLQRTGRQKWSKKKRK